MSGLGGHGGMLWRGEGWLMTQSWLVPGNWECQRRDTQRTHHNLVFRGLGGLGHGHHHNLATTATCYLEVRRY